MSLDLDRALEIVDKLTAAGILAVLDPRSATPPCVLGTPANGRLDLACGFTAEWSWYVLVPGPGNLDAWRALVELRDAVLAVVPAERFDFLSYLLDPQSPSLPAYRIQFEEGIA